MHVIVLKGAHDIVPAIRLTPGPDLRAAASERGGGRRKGKEGKKGENKLKMKDGLPERIKARGGSFLCPNCGLTCPISAMFHRFSQKERGRERGEGGRKGNTFMA